MVRRPSERSRKEARAPRPATESRLEHRRGDTFGKRRRNGASVGVTTAETSGVGEERDGRADPVAGGPSPGVKHRDECAIRLLRRRRQLLGE